jgi:signal transduction histidine kinase
MSANHLISVTTPSVFRRLYLLGGSLLCAAAVSAETPLKTALEIRSLPPQEAAKSLPVELRGTVVFVESPRGAVLIQDATAGTFFHGPDEVTLRIGDDVMVKGVTHPGRYLPGIKEATYEKLGHHAVPPGIPATFADLHSGRYHYQIVAVEGIVQAVRATGEEARTHLSLAIGQELLDVRVYAPLKEGDLLVDSRVHIEGLAAGSINHRRQLVQPSVWLQDWSGLTVLEAAPPESEVPTITGSKLLAFQPVGQGGHRVRVTGTVIATLPDGAVFIRDGATALGLQLLTPVSLRPGTRIEVLGFPKMQHFSASLASAKIVQQEPGLEPLATEARMADLLHGTHDNDLVVVTAELSGCFRTEDGHVLVLLDRGKTIRAHLPTLERDLPTGARVRVTGICHVESSTTVGVTSLPRSVSLRCRRPGDVTVLTSPSWWTVRRVALSAGVLLLALILAALWIIALRRQVGRQTTALRQRIEQEAAHEERLRIAREFHDTLEQGLAGLSLRLDAVQARGMDEKSGQLLRASRGLVSQIQAETRSLVSELREPSQEIADLAAALREIVEEHPAECGPALALEASASLPSLPSRTVHHLRMITREAVTNALKHAHARHIRITVELKDGRLRMVIADDGRGFDPEVPRGGRGGHFGCIGIEERCEKLGASALWQSAPDRGTTIVIELSLEESAAASNGSAAHLPLK